MPIESLFANGKLLTIKVKRLASEDMNIDRLARSWNATATPGWSIDARRDRVCEAVPGKYYHQSERASRRAMSDFQQILIESQAHRPSDIDRGQSDR
jgi:hypothetical protein